MYNQLFLYTHKKVLLYYNEKRIIIDRILTKRNSNDNRSTSIMTLISYVGAQQLQCQVHVTNILIVKPQANADNDYDFYGYEEVEYELKDIRGFPTQGSNTMLESIITSNDEERIKEEILTNE